MRTGGHYFCDKCDEIIFAAYCTHHHLAARWVPHTPAKPAVIDDETGRKFFADLRARVAATPDPFQS